MMMDNLPEIDANPLLDRLVEQYAGIKQRAVALLAALKNVPETITEDSIDPAIGFVKQLRAATHDAEEARIREKHDFLEAGRTVDAFFKGFTDSLTEAAKDIQGRMDAYMLEAGKTRGALGGTAFVEHKIEFEITDRALAVGSLHPFIDEEALAKAARALRRAYYATIKAGIARTPSRTYDMPGLRFFETSKARVV